MTVLVKKVKSYQITEKQLQVLLAYAEEDIYDTSRQATAFGLLKVWCHQNADFTVHEPQVRYLK